MRMRGPGPARPSEHSSLPPRRHHLLMCLLCASNIFMRRLINAFSFYLHCLSPSLSEQSKHSQQKNWRAKTANNTRRYFWLLSKKFDFKFIQTSCEPHRCFFFFLPAPNLSYALCASSSCVCLWDDAHNFLMNLYRGNYFGKSSLEWGSIE